MLTAAVVLVDHQYWDVPFAPLIDMYMKRGKVQRIHNVQKKS